MYSLQHPHFQRFSGERGHGGVVRAHVDERVGELQDGVRLVVVVTALPRHQLARRGLAGPGRARQPDDPPRPPGLGRYVGTSKRKRMVYSYIAIKIAMITEAVVSSCKV